MLRLASSGPFDGPINGLFLSSELKNLIWTKLEDGGFLEVAENYVSGCSYRRS
jgi:hypothetical protein